MTEVQEHAGCHGKVLVVEDHDLVRSVLVQMLQRLGYSVLECEDGSTALEVLREQGEIGVVVTNVILPGRMDGIALSDWAKEHRPSIKVVLISGYAESEMAARGAQACGHEILSKPFTKSDLMRALLREK